MNPKEFSSKKKSEGKSLLASFFWYSIHLLVESFGGEKLFKEIRSSVDHLLSFSKRDLKLSWHSCLNGMRVEISIMDVGGWIMSSHTKSQSFYCGHETFNAFSTGAKIWLNFHRIAKKKSFFCFRFATLGQGWGEVDCTPACGIKKFFHRGRKHIN